MPKKKLSNDDAIALVLSGIKEMMKKIFCLVFICLLFFSAIGCSGKTIKSTNVKPSTHQLNNDDKYSLIDHQNIDVDGDGNADKLQLQSFFDKEMNSYKIKLIVNDNQKIIKFASPTRFNRVSKIFFTDLTYKRKGIMIKLYHSEDEEVVNDTPASYNLSYGCMVFGISDKQIKILLDTESLPYNHADNYDIKHLKGFNIAIVDKSTNLHAQYEIYYDEAMKSEYFKRINAIQEFKIPEAMAQNRFYSINFDPESKQIVMSKVIPGIYNNDVLGVLDYYYNFNNDKYILSEEVLYFNKVLGLPPIEEIKL